MSQPIPVEKKAEILAAIKENGVPIAEAASTFGIGKSTIKKWIRKKVDNVHSSAGELLRLRRENQLLKEIVASFVVEKELAKKRI